MSARDAVEARMRAKQAIDAAFEAAAAAGKETAAAIRDKDLSVTITIDANATTVGVESSEDEPE